MATAAIKAALCSFFFGAETPLVHGAFTSLDFLQNLVQRVQRQPLVPIHGIHSFFCLLGAFAASKEGSAAKLRADGILQLGGGTSNCPAAGPAGAAPVRQRRGGVKMKVILNSFLNI
jgi:hypothetical protein